MSYHTECDWCGAWLGHDDDQAQMTVTIKHRRGKGTLDAKWAEETKQTRHFCASPKEDTDEGGRNRAGLIPESELDSCYERAIAAMTRTELADPGMGMEWRLMRVEKRETPKADEPEKPKAPTNGPEWREHEDANREPREAWGRLSAERRESLLLNMLGEERLTLAESASRMDAELGHVDGKNWSAVYASDVRNLAMRMVRSGQLERVAEPFQGKVRYRYFKAGLEQPLERSLAKGGA